MLEDSQTTADAIETAAQTADEAQADAAPAKKAAAKKTAKKATAKKAAAKKTTARKTTAKKPASDAEAAPAAPADAATPADAPAEAGADSPAEAAGPETAATDEAPARKTAKKTAKKAAAKKTTTKRATAKKSAATTPPVEEPTLLDDSTAAAGSAEPATDAADEEGPQTGTALLFQAPQPAKVTTRRRSTKKVAAPPAGDEQQDDTAAEAAPEGQAAAEPADAGAAETAAAETAAEETTAAETAAEESAEESAGEGAGSRRRRRRGGRRRRKSGDGDAADSDESSDQAGSGDEAQEKDGGRAAAKGSGQGAEKDKDKDEAAGEGTSRRRRRRRRAGEEGDGTADDPENTVTRVRKGRSAEDQITAVSGSTRLEAKKQRRREGREAGRRRAPIVSEAEFLARREAVDRVMVIRQRQDLTQIAVLEDKVLVEHYVARESQTSLIGNVYLGRVQNVLPSMEAAFIDIGKGRNAVLYAGEVNWSALGHKDGQPRKIESVLSSGQSVLVQVTKDPVGHKGARLTSQISLAGRFLVYVPDGTTSGISRKLPDTERGRLKSLLKEIVPDGAGVIVRTAAEGASEDELTRDVERLKARWEDIEKKSKGNAPQLLYGEPDLTLKVVRDLFTEDFSKLVIEGDDAWDTVQGYVSHVAPDLEDRLERHDADGGRDVFATYRIDEQIAKGLDRKVWLPSGGSLIIDRTEAMTVVDVNTGKFTGSGGNLEETVTKNNLEAAEEIVRQLRLRDIGGIIVVDFIDMVLESNRDLVLRRLVECLGRDRTRHQVAEVTSLGLVQMTRKRIGTGLLEAFSETCEHCQGRGLQLHDMPVEARKGDDDSRRGGRRGRGRGRGGEESGADQAKDQQKSASPSPKDVAAMAKPETGTKAADAPVAQEPEPEAAAEPVSEPEQKPAGKRSGRKSAGKKRPAEPDATAAAVEEEAPEPEPAAAPEPEEQAEPPKPQVVTRTRTRRSASRPAGASTPTPEPVVVSSPPVGDTVPATTAEGATVPPQASPEPAADASKPQVVTRTRRRSASRPAGPPSPESGTVDGQHPVGGAASAGQVGEPPVTGTVEPGTAESDPAPAVEHVPIKKKGARKR